MKQLYTLFFLSVSLQTLSQSDDPCGAPALTVVSSCSFISGTTVGSTNTTSVASPSCSIYSNADVWYTLTVPASGHIVVSTQAGTGGSGITDGAMSIYSGTCFSLTELQCVDDEVSLMPEIDESGLTPGSTIWVRFWKYSFGTGTFKICAYELPASVTPANDNPCAATTLTVTTSCILSPGSTSGATSSSGVPSPGCASYLGGDVWFQITVPPSGSITLETASGDITDGGMAIYSGTCTSLSLILCDDDLGTGLMPLINTSGLTPGSTLFIRFWEYGDDIAGTFQICVWEPVVTPGGENNDCLNATQLCSTESFDDNSSGTGSVTDLSFLNAGCLSSFERQPAWYIFQIASGGTFQLTINPETSSDDYDFGLWGPNPNCPPNTNPLRCSYSSSTNNTGVNSAINLPEVDFTEGVGGNKWVIDMNVLASEIYILMVDNFSISNDGFSISFGGTATIDCTPLPIQLTEFTGLHLNDYNLLNWITQSEINNNHFTVERSVDGETFEFVSVVNGSGNSVQMENYQYLDFQPFNGTTYYRLQQVDYNGQSSYSKVISVVSIEDKNLWIYPNPVEGGIINLSYVGVPGENYELEVINTVGHTIHTQKKTASGEVFSDQISLPCSGIYWVILKSKNKTMIEKVVY